MEVLAWRLIKKQPRLPGRIFSQAMRFLKNVKRVWYLQKTAEVMLCNICYLPFIFPISATYPTSCDLRLFPLSSFQQTLGFVLKLHHALLTDHQDVTSKLQKHGRAALCPTNAGFCFVGRSKPSNEETYKRSTNSFQPNLSRPFHKRGLRK